MTLVDDRTKEIVNILATCGRVRRLRQGLRQEGQRRHGRVHCAVQRLRPAVRRLHPAGCLRQLVQRRTMPAVRRRLRAVCAECAEACRKAADAWRQMATA